MAVVKQKNILQNYELPKRKREDPRRPRSAQSPEKGKQGAAAGKKTYRGPGEWKTMGPTRTKQAVPNSFPGEEF